MAKDKNFKIDLFAKAQKQLWSAEEFAKAFYAVEALRGAWAAEVMYFGWQAANVRKTLKRTEWSNYLKKAFGCDESSSIWGPSQRTIRDYIHFARLLQEEFSKPAGGIFAQNIELYFSGEQGENLELIAAEPQKLKVFLSDILRCMSLSTLRDKLREAHADALDEEDAEAAEDAANAKRKNKKAAVANASESQTDFFDTLFDTVSSAIIAAKEDSQKWLNLSAEDLEKLGKYLLNEAKTILAFAKQRRV